MDGIIRRWRGLNIGQFKTDESSWPEAMEKFYEGPVLLQDQLDEVHKHETLLMEVLQIAIRDEPFYLFVERAESVPAAHQYFHNCLTAISKQELSDKLRREKNASHVTEKTSGTASRQFSIVTPAFV